MYACLLCPCRTSPCGGFLLSALEDKQGIHGGWSIDLISLQVCSNVFDLNTDWNASGAEQLYTVNPASGEITTESRRRALLSSGELQFTSRGLLGGSATGAAAAANEPVSFQMGNTYTDACTCQNLGMWGFKFAHTFLIWT